MQRAETLHGKDSHDIDCLERKDKQRKVVRIESGNVRRGIGRPQDRDGPRPLHRDGKEQEVAGQQTQEGQHGVHAYFLSVPDVQG